VTLVSAEGRAPRELDSVVRGSLRARDKVFRLDGSGLIVVSPDTTPEAGEVLAAEIRRELTRRGNGGVAVVPITSAAQSSADEIFEAAEAVLGDAAAAGNGEAGNGASHGVAEGSEIRPANGSGRAQTGDVRGR
jgi:GGDEF domain-containing protein